MDGNSYILDLLQKYLAIENRGYTNEVRIGGLKKNQGFDNPRRRVLFLSPQPTLRERFANSLWVCIDCKKEVYSTFSPL